MTEKSEKRIIEMAKEVAKSTYENSSNTEERIEAFIDGVYFMFDLFELMKNKGV
jgi:hypothetical protein